MRDGAISQEDLIKGLPCWAGTLSIEPLHGGLSNESHLVRDGRRAFVVRFGVDYPFHHVERAREVMVAKAAHAAGFAPKVHYAAPGVMVSEFITGKTYEASDVRRNADAIAALVARFHNEMAIHVSGSASLFWVFHVVRDYVRTLGAYKSQWSVQLAGYLALNAELEAAQAALPIVFAHNDLLPANFIDDGAKLWLIDFEYAGFSTAMFDVASVAAHGQMSDDEAQGFLQRYFGGRNDSVSLRGSFLAMQCAAILREALWAMVSDHYLKTPGVDFKAYAQENLARLEAALEQYRKATS